MLINKEGQTVTGQKDGESMDWRQLGGINGECGDYEIFGDVETFQATQNHFPGCTVDVYKAFTAFIHTTLPSCTLDPPIIRGMFPNLLERAYLDDMC